MHCSVDIHNAMCASDHCCVAWFTGTCKEGSRCPMTACMSLCACTSSYQTSCILFAWQYSYITFHVLLNLELVDKRAHTHTYMGFT